VLLKTDQEVKNLMIPIRCLCKLLHGQGVDPNTLHVSEVLPQLGVLLQHIRDRVQGTVKGKSKILPRAAAGHAAKVLLVLGLEVVQAALGDPKRVQQLQRKVSRAQKAFNALATTTAQKPASITQGDSAGESPATTPTAQQQQQQQQADTPTAQQQQEVTPAATATADLAAAALQEGPAWEQGPADAGVGPKPGSAAAAAAAGTAGDEYGDGAMPDSADDQQQHTAAGLQHCRALEQTAAAGVGPLPGSAAAAADTVGGGGDEVMDSADVQQQDTAAEHPTAATLQEGLAWEHGPADAGARPVLVSAAAAEDIVGDQEGNGDDMMLDNTDRQQNPTAECMGQTELEQYPAWTAAIAGAMPIGCATAAAAMPAGDAAAATAAAATGNWDKAGNGDWVGTMFAITDSEQDAAAGHMGAVGLQHAPALQQVAAAGVSPVLGSAAAAAAGAARAVGDWAMMQCAPGQQSSEAESLEAAAQQAAAALEQWEANAGASPNPGFAAAGSADVVGGGAGDGARLQLQLSGLMGMAP
jgi:hypothetical protein